jgi:hypothetical protein
MRSQSAFRAGKLPPMPPPEKRKAGADLANFCWLRNIVSFFTVRLGKTFLTIYQKSPNDKDPSFRIRSSGDPIPANNKWIFWIKVRRSERKG